MILEPGEKIFVATRRQFESDQRRHFIGVVERCTEQSVRAVGYVFIMSLANKFEKKPEERTLIFSLTDAGNLINVLPAAAHLESIQYGTQANRLYLTDDEGFRYDINEFRSG